MTREAFDPFFSFHHCNLQCAPCLPESLILDIQVQLFLNEHVFTGKKIYLNHLIRFFLNKQYAIECNESLTSVF